MKRSCLFILVIMLSISLHAQKVVTLHEDVVLSEAGDLLGIPHSSEDSEKLTITSHSHKSIIIKENGRWDLAQKGYASIEFAGNARLICEPGSRLHGTGGVLRFVDEARFIVGKG